MKDLVINSTHGLWKKINNSFSISLTLSSSLFFISIVAAIIIFDSTIVKFIAVGYKQMPTYTNVYAFVTLSIIFVMCITILMRTVKKSAIRDELYLRRPYNVVLVCQYSIFSILLVIILEMMVLKNYNIILLFFDVYISHVLAIIFLCLLVVKFVSWLASYRNSVVLTFAASFSAIASTLFLSLFYLTRQFSLHQFGWSIRPWRIHDSLMSLPGSEAANSVGIPLDILSFISFVLTWIASVVLLARYRERLGKKKYWVIVCIPLIYFLFPFEIYITDLFSGLNDSSPVLFGTMEVIVFSATKQVGAVLFALVFLTTSMIIKPPKMRQALAFTGIGTALLFSSLETDSLIYAVYPPYGLVTVSFMSVGSYLLYIGFITSSKYVSQDIEIRKEFRKSAESQLALLRTIGVSQMEQQLKRTFKNVWERSKTFQDDENYEPDEEDVKLMVRDILDEIHKKDINNHTKKQS